MKVAATIKVDIDTEAWTMNYGVEGAAIRQDVKDYIEDLVKQQLNELGLLTGGTY